MSKQSGRWTGGGYGDLHGAVSYSMKGGGGRREVVGLELTREREFNCFFR